MKLIHIFSQFYSESASWNATTQGSTESLIIYFHVQPFTFQKKKAPKLSHFETVVF